ncbi:hypothetical protein ACWCXK_32485, partial [Streptomyces sp. NPDC001739]
LQTVMEEISGGRMHYMFNRVGGLKEDLPDPTPMRHAPPFHVKPAHSLGPEVAEVLLKGPFLFPKSPARQRSCVLLAVARGHGGWPEGVYSGGAPGAPAAG